MSDATALRALLLASGEVVESACNLVNAMLADPLVSWSKTDKSPVTAIDLAVDRHLRAGLSALAPDAAWLSEETADNPERLTAERLWIVDPIDGTKALLKGVPEFCISVALITRDRGPVLALIANPSTGQRFTAQVGQGAHTEGGEVLRVAPHAGERPLRLAVSRGEFGRNAWGPFADEVELVPCSGLACKMALVAAGEVDATVTPCTRSEWDAAAGDLIVSEAGGWSGELVGTELRYNLPQPLFRGVVCTSAAASGRVKALAQRVQARFGTLKGQW